MAITVDFTPSHSAPEGENTVLYGVLVVSADIADTVSGELTLGTKIGEAVGFGECFSFALLNPIDPVNFVVWDLLDYATTLDQNSGYPQVLAAQTIPSTAAQSASDPTPMAAATFLDGDAYTATFLVRAVVS